MIYDYPPAAHQRRHGPYGYADYRSYKDWLRDEFCFRCVYCLGRERWSKDGADVFSVDHVVPASVAPHLETDYGNLVYACLRCNSRKSEVLGLPDPSQVAFGNILQVHGDGTVTSGRPDGLRLIRILKLDDDQLVEHRRELLRLLNDLSARPEAQDRLRYWFGFPNDVPNLRSLRPEGNALPEGLEQSWFARRARGDMPATY